MSASNKDKSVALFNVHLATVKLTQFYKVNVTLRLAHWKVDTSFINEHDPITATLDVQIPRHVPATHSYRNYKGICAEKLRDFLSALIWRELEDLGITTSKSPLPARFSLDARNKHFSFISNDPQASSVEEYLRTLKSLDQPEHFIFRAITESDVSAAVSHFNTQARGSDGIP
ncbi:hypothetical protein TSAR_013167 [Trichomalopsis sarcophagae]|uniref:Uncharacterized protein n=1 Tax=Trichomalopsis sarcophagae TaxID=543379 RepID=A0A232EP90_9HYME|nr:hypothetical protein TSAR_013167 [Trichomalopsis sarcophagae]